jgi:hypothetical protein
VLSREKIEARKKALEANKVQLVGNLNAISGAIQILEELLSEKEESDDSDGVPAEDS